MNNGDISLAVVSHQRIHVCDWRAINNNTQDCCHPISDYVVCHTASSGGYWRHFYSDSEATALCELFLTAPNRNMLAYLLFSITGR